MNKYVIIFICVFVILVILYFVLRPATQQNYLTAINNTQVTKAPSALQTTLSSLSSAVTGVFGSSPSGGTNTNLSAIASML